jgi:hypothetical protein
MNSAPTKVKPIKNIFISTIKEAKTTNIPALINKQSYAN